MKLPILEMDMSESRSLDNNVAVLLMFILPWHLLLVSYPRQGITHKTAYNGSSRKPVSVSLIKAFVQLWNLLGMENYKKNAYKLCYY